MRKGGYKLYLMNDTKNNSTLTADPDSLLDPLSNQTQEEISEAFKFGMERDLKKIKRAAAKK